MRSSFSLKRRSKNVLSPKTTLLPSISLRDDKGNSMCDKDSKKDNIM